MTTKKIQDHLSREIEIPYPPKRIISLAPGITDTLYALQLENEMIGRTRYCIHPKPQVEQAKIVGGTKKIKLDVIQSLKPDLIICEKEENTKEIVDQLEQFFPVFVAEVQSVDDAYQLIEDLGAITGKKDESLKLINQIDSKLNSLVQLENKRVAYVIWKKPYMVVGRDTYINSLLEKLGFTNVFKEYEGRYPAIEKQDFQNKQLDYLFLATEPFPFTDEHLKEFEEMLPNVKTIILDGEMFWYGPRMIEATSYLNDLLYKL